jgi:hypothetical protein
VEFHDSLVSRRGGLSGRSGEGIPYLRMRVPSMWAIQIGMRVGNRLRPNGIGSLEAAEGHPGGLSYNLYLIVAGPDIMGREPQKELLLLRTIQTDCCSTWYPTRLDRRRSCSAHRRLHDVGNRVLLSGTRRRPSGTNPQGSTPEILHPQVATSWT